MKKRKARKPRRNPLQIRVRRIRVPKELSATAYLDGLMDAVRTRHLPVGWHVEIGWRNPAVKKGKSRDWRYREFTDTLRRSRGGFATVVYRVLRRARARLEREVLPKLRAEQKEFLRRSEAAKKGWATRRERAEARSRAAKKGWKTRRAKQ